MCRVETFLIATALLLVQCGALHMYPEIFDPAKFLQRPLPPKAHSARAAEPVGVGVAESTGGFLDGEAGFVRSSSESGKGGYRHRENFHKKDGNKYGHEKQTGFGEAKRSADEATDGKAEHGKLMMVPTDHYRSKPNPYEVTEEQSDFENPDKHKKYGAAGQKEKKPIAVKQSEKKSSRQTVPAKPKDRSNQKKNHNGYESIVYHENERDSSEHGYGKRKMAGKLPARKPAKQIAAQDDDHEQAYDDETERDYDHESDGDSDAADAGRESDFDDNYEAVRFDSDFGRSFNSEEQGEGGNDGDVKDSGRSTAGQDQDYDYDAEVDRDEVDESASEDKYRGGEDSEEEDGEDRQYEYASEADGDAQDY